MRVKKSLSFPKKLGRWVVYTRGGGFVWWSRVVYQNFVLGGKKIPKGIIIHHKNQDPTDDRPENLEATVRKIHAPIHHEGTTHSEETKRKIGEGNSGKERSWETRQKLTEAHLGKSLSAEHSKRISEGLSGKPKSPEHVEKVRQALFGRTLSQETRQKISEAKKGKPGTPHSPEAKAKISKGRIEYFQNKRNSE